MRIVMCAVAVLVLAGCASAPLPKEQREFTFVEQTNLKKADAYNQALAYLAKNLGDSNFAIKVKDAETGMIITQIAFDCSELKTSFMDAMAHTAEYNLEFGAKDNKVRLVYEALEDRPFIRLTGKPGDVRAIATEAQAEAAKKCATTHKDELIKAISASAKKSNDW